MGARLLVATLFGAIWLIGATLWLIFGKIRIFSMRAPFSSEIVNRLFLTVLTSIYYVAVLGWIVPLGYCLYLVFFHRR